jgi:predicted dehydrogenase
MQRFRLGLVGAGAVAQQFHLPAIKRHPYFQLSCIADPAIHTFSFPAKLRKRVTLLSDFEEADFSALDAAIVATPNAYHFPVAKALLSQGIHVLAEKPVTLHADHYASLSRCQTNGTCLKSGMVKRHAKLAGLLQECFRNQFLGRLRHFDLKAGMVFNWPLQGLGLLERSKTGGGVLMDNGIHALDLLFWAYSHSAPLPQVKSFDYRDDSCGGIEAECQAKVHFTDDLQGSFTFSRLRPLTNRWDLYFDHGTLSIHDQTVYLEADQQVQRHFPFKAFRKALKEPMRGLFRNQLTGFYQQISNGTMENDPVIPFILDLINRFYENSKNLKTSYYQFQ